MPTRHRWMPAECCFAQSGQVVRERAIDASDALVTQCTLGGAGELMDRRRCQASRMKLKDVWQFMVTNGLLVDGRPVCDSCFRRFANCSPTSIREITARQTMPPLLRHASKQLNRIAAYRHCQARTRFLDVVSFPPQKLPGRLYHHRKTAAWLRNLLRANYHYLYCVALRSTGAPFINRPVIRVWKHQSPRNERLASTRKQQRHTAQEPSTCLHTHTHTLTNSDIFFLIIITVFLGQRWQHQLNRVFEYHKSALWNACHVRIEPVSVLLRKAVVVCKSIPYASVSPSTRRHSPAGCKESEREEREVLQRTCAKLAALAHGRALSRMQFCVSLTKSVSRFSNSSVTWFWKSPPLTTFAYTDSALNIPG